MPANDESTYEEDFCGECWGPCTHECDSYWSSLGPEYWASVEAMEKQGWRARQVMKHLRDDDCFDTIDFDNLDETQEQINQWSEKLNLLIREHLDSDSIWSFVRLAGDFRESVQGKSRARRRHITDPKYEAKLNVKDCWQNWQKNPLTYRSKSAFARDMLEKYEVLQNPRVIERWCKEWETAPSEQSTY